MFLLLHTPNTPRGTSLLSHSGKTKRDRAKDEHPLRALREMCAEVGMRPAAGDTEAQMNERLRMASGRGPKQKS